MYTALTAVMNMAGTEAIQWNKLRCRRYAAADHSTMAARAWFANPKA